MKAPQRLVRAMTDKVETDVKNRILKRAVFVTRYIATDGGIVLPAGINVKPYADNPVVLSMHGHGAAFPVVGRSLGLKGTADGMESVTQFADTAIGRELAYLYGVNEAGEVYARGWSFGWDNVAVETWTLDRALATVPDQDPETIPAWVRRMNEVWVAVKSVMNEYSAVPLGADRKALSRAWSANVDLAGRMLASLDLDDAQNELAAMRAKMESQGAMIERLEKDVQALRRDGPAAVTRGDSAEVLEQVRRLSARYAPQPQQAA
jgi:hypothetical protein